MDDDDPEKRIAELERRLADPPRPAAPGPPRYRDAREQPAPIPGPIPGHGGPIAPRVYVATVLDRKWGYPKVIGLIAVLCGGPVVLAALLHTTSGEVALWMHDAVFVVIPLLVLVAYVTRSRRLKSLVSGRWPEVTIHAAPDALEVITGNGKRAVFPVATAAMGPWTAVGAPPCAALHLRNDRHRFVIGGQNPRVPVRVPRIAGRVWTVNASLPAAEFAELLHIVFP
jgi:hypothetical protein